MCPPIELVVFKTELGWLGAAGRSNRALWLSVGHATRAATVAHARATFGIDLPHRTWSPTLRKRLIDYAAGVRVSFVDIPLDLSGLSLFDRRVLEACRKIRYGRTSSYTELARAAGHPEAARAVGRAMARNRFPLLIPCHRVIRRDGHLGGYSAPRGLPLKRRLLQLEGSLPTGPLLV